MTLSQAGIVSINLHDTVEPQLQNGNRILERSTVTMSDGRTLQMADVYFETDAVEAAQAQAQSDAVPVAAVPPPARHQASIMVQSLLNARDPIVASMAASLVAQTSPAPAKHASVTSGRANRPAEGGAAVPAPAIHASVTSGGTKRPVKTSATGPAPAIHASVTSGRMKRPADASATPTPQRILPDVDLKQPWDTASMVLSSAPLTAPSTAVIDWSQRRAPLIERFPEIPVHAAWAVDFLGVNKNPRRDLGSLTGLSIRIPETPNRADSI
jgi:hypothetical protein